MFTEIYGTYEEFVKTFQGIIDDSEKAWDGINEKAEKLGFKMSGEGENKTADVFKNMSTEAANAWASFSERILPGGAEANADGTDSNVNTALSELTAGMNSDQVDQLMSAISGIDPTDINAWSELEWQI